MILRSLAIVRRASGQPSVRYSDDEKITYVAERGAWVPSYESDQVTGTKKADMETGEDQKGQ